MDQLRSLDRRWPAAVALLSLCVGGWFLTPSAHPPRLRNSAAPSRRTPLASVGPPLLKDRRVADSDLLGNPRRAKTEYKRFIAEHKDDPDPKVQNEVAGARIRLGDALARTDGMAAARVEFLSAAAEYKGDADPSPDFGSLPDQARFQAIVCLSAEGRKKEAEAGFLNFIKGRPLSPLCHACYQRLERMNGGAAEEAWTRAYQKALDAQESRTLLEASSCGPKCIQHVLQILDPAKKEPDYQQIAKICGTNGKGTSLDQMCKGLRELGHVALPYQIAAADLRRAPLPAIVLKGDHYFVIEKLALGKATVYDPFDGKTRVVAFTAPPSPDTSLTAILLRPFDPAS